MEFIDFYIDEIEKEDNSTPYFLPTCRVPPIIKVVNNRSCSRAESLFPHAECQKGRSCSNLHKLKEENQLFSSEEGEEQRVGRKKERKKESLCYGMTLLTVEKQRGIGFLI